MYIVMFRIKITLFDSTWTVDFVEIDCRKKMMDDGRMTAA